MLPKWWCTYSASTVRLSISRMYHFESSRRRIQGHQLHSQTQGVLTQAVVIIKSHPDQNEHGLSALTTGTPSRSTLQLTSSLQVRGRATPLAEELVVAWEKLTPPPWRCSSSPSWLRKSWNAAWKGSRATACATDGGEKHQMSARSSCSVATGAATELRSGTYSASPLGSVVGDILNF